MSWTLKNTFPHRKYQFPIMLPHHCSSLKKVRTLTQTRLQTGADEEAMEECCWLACSFWLFSLFSYITQAPQSKDGVTDNGLDPFLSITNEGIVMIIRTSHAHTGLPISLILQRNFPKWGSFLPNGSSFFTLTQNQPIQITISISFLNK